MKDFGVGRLFRRSHWPEGSYLRLIKFVPTTNSIAGHNRGKATVLRIWKGEVDKKPIIMNGPLKKVWKLVDKEEQEEFFKKFPDQRILETGVSMLVKPEEEQKDSQKEKQGSS